MKYCGVISKGQLDTDLVLITILTIITLFFSGINKVIYIALQFIKYTKKIINITKL